MCWRQFGNGEPSRPGVDDPVDRVRDDGPRALLRSDARVDDALQRCGPLDRDLVANLEPGPGGVNVAFLDGSVKFVKSTTNYNAWLAIGTIAGGEVISADAL